MVRDWDAVGAAIRARMRELEITQAELAQRANVALMTVRELQRNLKARRRNPRTLAAISEALDWPAEHLSSVLAGTDSESNATRLDRIEARLDALEKLLGGDPADPH